MCLTRRNRFLACLLVGASFATGAGWWDGLDVDRDRYDRSYVQAGVDYEEAARELSEALADLDVVDLLARCEEVVEAGEATSARRSTPPVPGVVRPDRVDWLLCLTALRQIGSTGDTTWLPILNSLSERWTDAAWGIRVGRRRFLFHLLGTKTGEAYRQIAFPDTPPAQIVRAWRETYLEVRPERARQDALALAMNDLRRQRPSDPEFLEAYLKLFEDPEPAVRSAVAGYPVNLTPPGARDARVAAIADRDALIRERAARSLLSEVHPIGEPAAASLLRFLAREDIDDEARDVATRSLRIQGYELGRGPDGRPMAVPVQAGRSPITLPVE